MVHSEEIKISTNKQLCVFILSRENKRSYEVDSWLTSSKKVLTLLFNCCQRISPPQLEWIYLAHEVLQWK